MNTMITGRLTFFQGVFTFLLFLALQGAVWLQTSQALDPRMPITHYIHDTWGPAEGLPQNSVFVVIQDRHGYLWLGTQIGLVRFDGINFHLFSKTNIPQMKNCIVRALYQDHHDNLWMGTTGTGLIRRNAADGSFTRITSADGLIGKMVWSIQPQEPDILLVRTETCLNRVHIDTGKVTPYTTPPALTGHTVTLEYRDKDGSLWLGTKNHGLFRMKNGTITASFTQQDGLTSDQIFSVYEDRNRALWVVTKGGLHRIKDGIIKRYTLQDGLTGNDVRAICEDRDGNLWLGTNGGGLHRLTNGTMSLFNEENGLPANDVMSLCVDGEDNLWVGTVTGGLSCLKERYVDIYDSDDGLPDDSLHPIYHDSRNRLWMGTQYGLTCLQNGKLTTYSVKDGLSPTTPMSIHEDRVGNLWIGTWGGGLSRFNDGKFTCFSTENGLSDNYILCMDSDPDGTLWIGTIVGGLNCYKDGKFTSFTPKDGLSGYTVTSVHRDRRGILWVGCTEGLNRFDETAGKFISYTSAKAIGNVMIGPFYEDREGVLWFCTDSGLYCLKDGTVSVVTEDDGLFNDYITSIQEDHLGNLWMSCKRGIFRVPKKEITDLLAGKRQRIFCTSYDEQDGMKTRECSMGWPIGTIDADGKLWYATMAGAAVIDPGKHNENTLPPPISIHSFTVDRKTIPALLSFLQAGKEIPLPPGKGSIEINYDGLCFQAPRKIRFKYKLEGFDSQWQDAGTRRTAYYTNLPHGHYTFHVIGCNNHGIWNQTGARLSFHLAPHFHQSVWFLLLSLMVGGLLIVSLYRLRVRSMKIREKELRLLVDERTQGLRKAKNAAEEARVAAERERQAAEDARNTAEAARRDAQEANRAKSDFLANMSHEIRTPMNAVLGFTRILEEEITHPPHLEYLRAVSVGGKTLLGLINDILDLSRIEAGKMELHYEAVNPASLLKEIQYFFTAKMMEKNLELLVELDPRLPSAVMLDDLRVRQILINLVGNAVKFTHRGHVKLSARVYETSSASASGSAASAVSVPPVTVVLQFLVEDTGIGIPKDQVRRIFDAFVQQQGQKASQYGGTGLGLAISKKLVNMMGGNITIVSTPGEGSTFTVTFPEVAVADVPVPDVSPIAQTGDQLRFAPAVLLTADDNAPNRHLIRTYLRNSGLEIIEAANGRQAVQMVKSHRPALVLMDYKMPEMDGEEAAAILKADDEMRHIPIIMVTASALKDPQRQFQEGNHDGFLNKPLTKEALVEQLKRFLPCHTSEPETGPQSVVQNDGVDSAPPELKAQEVNLSALFQALQREHMAVRSQTIRKTLFLDDMESFSQQVLALSRQYPWEPLTRWSHRFAADVLSFDMNRIALTLGEFPQLMEQLDVLTRVD